MYFSAMQSHSALAQRNHLYGKIRGLCDHTGSTTGREINELCALNEIEIFINMNKYPRMFLFAFFI